VLDTDMCLTLNTTSIRSVGATCWNLKRVIFVIEDVSCKISFQNLCTLASTGSSLMDGGIRVFKCRLEENDPVDSKWMIPTIAWSIVIQDLNFVYTILEYIFFYLDVWICFVRFLTENCILLDKKIIFSFLHLPMFCSFEILLISILYFCRQGQGWLSWYQKV